MFRPKYPDTVQPNYSAFCEIHVRLLASILTLLYILAATFLLIGCIIFAKVLIPFPLVLMAIYIAVLVADKYEQPMLYLPFLIVQFILLLLGIAIIIFSIAIVCQSKDFVGFIVKSNDLTDKKTDSGSRSLHVTLVIAIACVLLFEVFGFYVLKTVVRARHYMIKEVISGKVERNAKAIGYDFNEPKIAEGKF